MPIRPFKLTLKKPVSNQLLLSIMKITISRNATQELAFRQLIFRQFAVRICLMLLLLIFLGLILIFFVKSEVNGVELPFWNLGSAFGFGLIMIGLLRFTDLLKKRSQLLDGATDTTIVFDQEEILYKRENFQVKYNWGYFKFYRINDKLILLMPDLSLINLLILRRDDISDEELKFIKDQLFQHKVTYRK
jgi:hypothetical protein